MNTGETFLPDDAARISREAAEWLVQRDGGLSPAQTDAFARWCTADPRHVAAYAHAARAHNRLLELPRSPAAAKLLAELDELTSRPARRPRAPLIPFFKSRVFATLAAAAATIVIATGVWWARHDSPHDRYATTTAMRRAIDLPDGSKLALSEQSSVRVDFRPTERRLQLEHGEARFDVANDARRPFRVFAGTVLVQAVGTEFTVQRSEESVEVTVTEGKVAVSRTAEKSDDAASLGMDLFALSAGERVVLDLRPTAPDRIATNLENGTATSSTRWPAPRLVFRDTPLGEVVERFNRFNRVQLVVTDPRLATRLVGGSFDADNAEAFVNLLRESGTITAERVSEIRLELRPAP